MYVMILLYGIAKLAYLELKTQPEQLVGSLPLALHSPVVVLVIEVIVYK